MGGVQGPRPERPRRLQRLHLRLRPDRRAPGGGGQGRPRGRSAEATDPRNHPCYGSVRNQGRNQRPVFLLKPVDGVKKCSHQPWALIPSPWAYPGCEPPATCAQGRGRRSRCRGRTTTPASPPAWPSRSSRSVPFPGPRARGWGVDPLRRFPSVAVPGHPALYPFALECHLRWGPSVFA